MAKKRKVTRAPKGDVSVKVDPKLKKLYDELVAAIREASRKEALDFDRRWEAADRIVSHDPPLYLLGGFDNEDGFFRAVMEEEPRVARRYLRVARFCSPDDEIAYGTTKLDAALGFLEAKIGRALEHPPLPIALARLRIPVAGGKTHDLNTATVAEITAATSKLVSASRKRPATPARSAVMTELAKVKSLKDVVVREHAGLLTFEHVPIAAVHHFVGALGRAKLPKKSG